MGVYIKEMEMPKGADECRIIIRANGQVIIDKKTYWEETEAVPIPPHGDLIGRNPLIDIAMHLRNRAKDEYAKRVIGSVIRYIAEAPTIIPADVPDNNVGNIPAEEGET